MSNILAIDPGTTNSAYIIVDKCTLKPCISGKISNEALLTLIKDVEWFDTYNIDDFVIEMVAGMGMRVGSETFDTAFWIGRFWQAMEFNIPKINPLLCT